MAVKKKFYVVREGRIPGIYKSWNECKKQVQGFKGAVFKGFVTEAEAKAYWADEETAAAEDGLVIYVDGSYYQGEYSWAMAAYADGRLLKTASGKGKSADAAKLHNVAGEVEAAVEAVRWAETEGYEAYTICHDYIGLSEWAMGRWKANTPLTQEYAAFMLPYRQKISFCKVAGHTGVKGNELADQLAKKELGIIDEVNARLLK